MFHGSTAENQQKCKTPSPCIMQITLHIAKFNNIIFIVLIVKFNLVLNFCIEFWELPYFNKWEENKHDKMAIIVT